MKLLFTAVGVAALGLGAKTFLFPCPCDQGAPAPEQRTSAVAPAVDAPVEGDYLEARSVTLWGGHCHLNGEYDHQGRTALVAWSIDSGSFGGTDLAGVRVAAAVASDANLAEGKERTSDLFVDAPDADTRTAAEAWVRATHADALGGVASVRAAQILLERDGDAFRLEVEGLARVEGSAMADRSCCTMKEQRGYEPLMAPAGAVVGYAEVADFEGTEAQTGWTYGGANSVFLTRFSERPACDRACCGAPSRAALAP